MNTRNLGEEFVSSEADQSLIVWKDSPNPKVVNETRLRLSEVVRTIRLDSAYQGLRTIGSAIIKTSCEPFIISQVRRNRESKRR